MRRAVFIAFLLSSFSAFESQAIDIPLSGAGGGTAGQRIGYVDMDRIFQVFPETKNAKEDYAERRTKLKEALRQREEEFENLRARIGVLESTVKDLESETTRRAQEGGDQAELPAEVAQGMEAPQSVAELRAELEQKEVELEEARARAENELRTFERQQSRIILGQIYEALKQLAEEEQINLVVDKSSILYGSAEVDLTEELQRRVRGY